MKAYTDLDQSRKLAEILPIETSDMYYVNSDVDKLSIGKWKDEMHDEDDIPCWSLSALLDILPSGKALIQDKWDLAYKCICNNIDTSYFNNPVDACVELIIELKEKNLL